MLVVLWDRYNLQQKLALGEILVNSKKLDVVMFVKALQKAVEFEKEITTTFDWMNTTAIAEGMLG